jgi:hypothetical protein
VQKKQVLMPVPQAVANCISNLSLVMWTATTAIVLATAAAAALVIVSTALAIAVAPAAPPVGQACVV